jgi:hypothetical protein
MTCAVASGSDCCAPSRRRAQSGGRSRGDYERNALEPVSRNELARPMKDGFVTVLDVGTEDEFAAGHLPRPATAMCRRGARARIRREVAVQPLPGQRGPSFVSPSVCASVIVRLVIEGDAERPVSRGHGASIFRTPLISPAYWSQIGSCKSRPLV